MVGMSESVIELVENLLGETWEFFCNQKVRLVYSSGVSRETEPIGGVFLSVCLSVHVHRYTNIDKEIYF